MRRSVQIVQERPDRMVAWTVWTHQTIWMLPRMLPPPQRPPRLVHLIVSDGDRPASTAPVSRVDPAIFLRRRYPQHEIGLAHRHWTRSPATLSLGDCFNDHVCYRWTSRRRHHLVSIHAWSPLTQTLRVFARVVRSAHVPSLAYD
jgi:hypothetical protein